MADPFDAVPNLVPASTAAANGTLSTATGTTATDSASSLSLQSSLTTQTPQPPTEQVQAPPPPPPPATNATTADATSLAAPKQNPLLDNVSLGPSPTTSLPQTQQIQQQTSAPSINPLLQQSANPQQLSASPGLGLGAASGLSASPQQPTINTNSNPNPLLNQNGSLNSGLGTSSGSSSLPAGMESLGAVGAPSLQKMPPVYVEITGTVTKLSFLMQEYTDYIIEVHDFGKKRQINHRFNDFFNLHAELQNLDLNLPQLPPKGLDSTDPMVIADRKAKLTSFLQYCLKSEVIRLEKQLNIWKFLEFENAGLSVTRFVMGPAFVRDNLFKTLPKLCTDDKYANDLFRLAHVDFLNICMDHICSENPVHVVQAATLITGGIKIGKQHTIDIITSRSEFLPRLFQFFAREEYFPAVRQVLSSILIVAGDRFPQIMSPVLCNIRDTTLELLQNQSLTNVHELIAKITWFSLEDDLKRFLFSEAGLPVVVSFFGSPDKHAEICAVLISAVAIVSGSVDESRAGELHHKMEECWPGATHQVGEADPNLVKFTTSLCHNTLALSRVAALLTDRRFSKYGLWLLRKANLNLRNLQQISGNLNQILEVPDHPCRFHAAELLLKVQDHDLSKEGDLDGLPHFEESLEKAILDPLAISLDSCHQEIVTMKTNTQWQVEKVESCFPKLSINNEQFVLFDKALQKYLQIQEDLKTDVQENNNYAADILKKSDQCRSLLQNTTFSLTERSAYVERLAELQNMSLMVAEQKRNFTEKDGTTNKLGTDLQKKHREVQELENALQEVDRQVQEKRRIIQSGTDLVNLKRQQLMTNVDDQMIQARQLLQQAQDKQKQLAMIHMKISQGENIDLTAIVSTPQQTPQAASSVNPLFGAGGNPHASGLAGKIKIVKDEHAKWKTEETNIQKKMVELQSFNPAKLQEEISRLENQIAEAESIVLQLDAKKGSLAQKLAEHKVDFESEKHTYTQHKQVRDEVMKEMMQSEDNYKKACAKGTVEIKQRHDGLSQLMGAAKDVGGRCGILEGKISGISTLLNSEMQHRQDLRDAIHSLGAFLTRLDTDLSKLGEEQENASSQFASQPNAESAGANPNATAGEAGASADSSAKQAGQTGSGGDGSSPRMSFSEIVNKGQEQRDQANAIKRNSGDDLLDELLKT